MNNFVFVGEKFNVLGRQGFMSNDVHCKIFGRRFTVTKNPLPRRKARININLFKIVLSVLNVLGELGAALRKSYHEVGSVFEKAEGIVKIGGRIFGNKHRVIMPERTLGKIFVDVMKNFRLERQKFFFANTIDFC